MPLQVGETINNRYRILAPISQGGFGEVYRAWDENLEQVVALKGNMLVTPQAQRQFRREAILLANLRHPNLPRVIDHFVLPDLGQYLIMDFIEGHSLGEMLYERGRPFTEAEVLPWIRQVCSALTYLHSRQPPIIHRDVKPQNIVITPYGEAMLVDFGISKVMVEEKTTTVGARGITPGYSPPEQYGGTTDARSDIYALGATLYALLAGQKPTDSVLLVAGNEQLVPPRQMNETLDPKMEAAILKAMQLNRSRRFSDVDSLLAALEQEQEGLSADDLTVLDTPVVPEEPLPLPNRRAEPQPSPGKKARRVPVLAWAMGVLVIAAVTFWGWRLAAGSNSRETELNPTSEAIVQLSSGTTETAQPPQATVEFVAETATVEPSPTATVQPSNTPTVMPTATPTTTPTPPPQAGDIRVLTLPGGLEVTQVFVPAGSFMMGSTDDVPLALGDEKPQHEVTLDSFWIDQTEVTNRQFATFLNEAGNQQEGGVTWLEMESSHSLIEANDGVFQPKPGFEEHPVIEVSWYGAQAYCEWSDGRLPTEAEWEYAARGPDSPIYPWGNEFDGTLLNFCDESCEFDHRVATVNDGYERAAPVGTYPDGASWVGALDMSGNVWEWVNDWYDSGYYQNAPAENPAGPETGTYRVIRGGAWINDVHNTRAANRLNSVPILRLNDVGFRCAQEYSSP